MDICHGGWARYAGRHDGAAVGLRDGGGGLESRFLRTVHLDIDYLAAVPLGAGVEGRARLLHRTARMVFADGTLEVGGEPVLRASGLFRIRPETWPLAIG